MITDLFVDDNDSLNGDPQQLLQMKLVDRDKLLANNPKAKGIISLKLRSLIQTARQIQAGQLLIKS
jgi:hypothetical protein